MLTPYDWQESIGHRAQFVEGRLAHGAPVVAVSIESGILIVTYKRQASKIFEIYDQLAMAAIGQQSDVEALRMAAIDFAHQEGYGRSEQDVTIQRVVTAMSAPIKRAFADFSSAPVVARGLFAEVGATPADDQFVMLDYDGDFHQRKGFGFLAQTSDSAAILDEKLSAAFLTTASIKTALTELEPIVLSGFVSEEVASPSEITEGLTREVALLERESKHVQRFRFIEEAKA